MNHVLADNGIQTMQRYIADALSEMYSRREIDQIVAAMFLRYKAMDRTQLLLNQNERLSESELLAFHFAIKRLKSGEPLQYVLGNTYFFGLEFLIKPGVLIPRPETEELVQAIIESNQKSNPVIVDVGTGSGCIAVTLAAKISGAEVYAVDISPRALQIAESNAALNHVAVKFSQMDVLRDELPVSSVDILVSNPPYVLDSDRRQMESVVLDYEPHEALFVPDNDPLLFYRRLIILAGKYLNAGGMLACEMHEDMEEQMMELFDSESRSRLKFYKDLQGKTRFFIYTKS